MDDKPLILGVDGGGSKTIAYLARAGITTEETGSPWTILGKGNSGPSNQQAVGFEAATIALKQAIAGSFADAAIDLQPISSCCLALAGSLLTGSPLLQGKLEEQLQNRELPADPIQAVTSPVLGTLQIAYQSLAT